MPLWMIHHPEGAYTAQDKSELAERISSLYNGANGIGVLIPKFYVGVVFQEVPKDSFYISAKPVDNFVRIWVDHIARTLPTPEAREHWVRISDEAIAPFVRDRGFDWEFHIDETPFDLWSIQGFRPPQPGSEDEKRWVAENAPSTHALA